MKSTIELRNGVITTTVKPLENPGLIEAGHLRNDGYFVSRIIAKQVIETTNENNTAPITSLESCEVDLQFAHSQSHYSYVQIPLVRANSKGISLGQGEFTNRPHATHFNVNEISPEGVENAIRLIATGVHEKLTDFTLCALCGKCGILPEPFGAKQTAFITSYHSDFGDMQMSFELPSASGEDEIEPEEPFTL